MSNTSDGLLSVVIPVYKAVDYLDQCVRSVLAQTYEHLEIILVDDGSPDDSGAMCDAWQRKDARIHAIHQDNKGAAVARNTGLTQATGEYVLFIDADDWIETDLAESCVQRLVDDHSDTAIFNYRHASKDGRQFEPSKISRLSPEDQVVTNVEAVDKLLQGRLSVTPWSSMTRTTIFSENHIWFPEGRQAEDRATTYRIYGSSHRVSLIGRPLYNYRVNDGSISHTAAFVYQQIDDGLQCYREMVAWISTHMPQLMPSVGRYGVDCDMWWLMFAHNNRRNMTRRQRSEVRGMLTEELHRNVAVAGFRRLSTVQKMKVIAASTRALPLLTAFVNMKSRKVTRLAADNSESAAQ